MSTRSYPWSVLEIDPTNDARAVRRAYAARLKAIDRSDPKQFQPLVNARDAALRELASTPARPDFREAAMGLDHGETLSPEKVPTPVEPISGPNRKRDEVEPIKEKYDFSPIIAMIESANWRALRAHLAKAPPRTSQGWQHIEQKVYERITADINNRRRQKLGSEAYHLLEGEFRWLSEPKFAAKRLGIVSLDITVAKDLRHGRLRTDPRRQLIMFFKRKSSRQIVSLIVASVMFAVLFGAIIYVIYFSVVGTIRVYS